MELNQNAILLTAANWETWKHEIKVLLIHYGAWEFIEKPEGEAVPEAEKLLWREKHDINLRKARSYTIIYQALSNDFKPLIAETTSGFEAWKILKEHFEPTTRARVIQLLDDFFSIRFLPEEDLGLFLCRIKQAAERLREVGHTLQQLYLGYQMIRSLPDDFQSIVQAIYRWPDSDFVASKIETELLLEDNRIKFARKDFLQSSTVAFAGDVKFKKGKIFESFSNDKNHIREAGGTG